MSGETETLFAHLKDTFPDVSLRRNPGPAAQHSLLVGHPDLVAVCRHLRDRHAFDLLSNITGVDWPDPAKADAVAIPEDEVEPRTEGFLEAVYHLYSTRRDPGAPACSSPLVLRARTRDRHTNLQIPSIVSIYRSAEFQEREIFDLFGVEFTGHPDLRRILMWDEFVDHPMRKDYVAPDDYEYEPTAHGGVLERSKTHQP